MMIIGERGEEVVLIMVPLKAGGPHSVHVELLPKKLDHSFTSENKIAEKLSAARLRIAWVAPPQAGGAVVRAPENKGTCRGQSDPNGPDHCLFTRSFCLIVYC